MSDPDPILARIAAEPGVREVSFPGESTQRNFFLNRGRRWLDIHYDAAWRLVCRGYTDDTNPEFLTDRMTLNQESQFADLETALAWLHEQKTETWRDRKPLL